MRGWRAARSRDFLNRLRTALLARDAFSDDAPDAWIQLSFEPLPAHVAERVRRGQTRILARMNGCWCQRHSVLRGLPLPWLDARASRRRNDRKNARIRQNLAEAHGVIYQSEFSRRLTHAFVDAAAPQGVVIYNGVDLDAFSPEGPVDSAIADDFKDSFNLLMSHSFQPYHRLHDAMKILAALRRQQLDKPVHLHVLGGADERCFGWAREIAHQKGLLEGRDFTIWGKRPFDALAPMLRGCDAMLNLSYWDACPNVAIEAMACGLPIIGVDHGGLAELVGAGSQMAGVLVSERIPFTYLDHQNPSRMPQAPIAGYVEAIAAAIPMTAALSEVARARAETRFDIRRICAEYLAAAQALTQEDLVSCG